MNPQIQLRKATQLFIVVVCFGFSPAVWAVIPAPDGGYPNANTAEGDNALLNLTTGSDNTAVGDFALAADTIGGANTANGAAALQSNTTGANNTATGDFALTLNTTGGDNTATGGQALQNNTTGANNTATGIFALFHNTTASNNTATGINALFSNTIGTDNTATGSNALVHNTTGGSNTATGLQALDSNTTGANNTANGENALFFNTTGFDNTAEGFQALLNNTGSSNIAVGSNAGLNLTTGNSNIDIGNQGVAGEAAKIRIGTVGSQTATFIAGIHGVAVTGTPVVVNSSGQLGVRPSAARFKEAIKPMDKVSEAILALKPVIFRYKHEIDPEGIRQFGLVAEDVEKVSPDLIVRDKEGKPYTVRYDAVNAMLLNEFLKEHCKVESLEKAMAEQQKENAAMQAMLKEQAAQIQQVSAQLEVSKPAPQTVLNNQ
jgi:hypothetical protein